MGNLILLENHTTRQEGSQVAQTWTQTGPLTDLLNRQVADWAVLYMKLHHFHWYVKGPAFYTLHAKFQEMYEEAAEHLDALAERVLTLGGEPPSTMAEMLKSTAVREAQKGETAERMVAELADDYARIAADLGEIIRQAEMDNDQPTADLLTQIRASAEKHRWMLQAYLGK